MKNPALLYEVSIFSALWMVFPESWKRSCPNFYAHDCIMIIICAANNNDGSKGVLLHSKDNLLLFRSKEKNHCTL